MLRIHLRKLALQRSQQGRSTPELLLDAALILLCLLVLYLVLGVLVPQLTHH